MATKRLKPISDFRGTLVLFARDGFTQFTGEFVAKRCPIHEFSRVRRVTTDMHRRATLRTGDERAKFLIEMSIAQRTTRQARVTNCLHRTSAGWTGLHRTPCRQLPLEQFGNNQRGSVGSRHDQAALDRVLGAKMHLSLDAVFNERLVDGGGIRTAVAQSLHGSRLRGVGTVAASLCVDCLGTGRNFGS